MSHQRRTCFAAALALGLLFSPAAWAQTPQTAAKADKPAKSARKAVAAPPQATLEPRVLQLLQAASQKLAAARTMAFTATVNYEYPSLLGPPLVYAMRYDVTLKRPDKLKVVIPGDGPASEFVYDGKEMTAFAPAENLAAVAEAPPTLDAALKKAFDTAAIYFPFADLLMADPYAALAEGSTHAFSIGASEVVGGTKTDMVALANSEVFLQIWIGVDDKLPRRIRAIYQADPLRLRHDMALDNWKLDFPMGQDAFASPAAHAAQRIQFADPALASQQRPKAPKK